MLQKFEISIKSKIIVLFILIVLSACESDRFEKSVRVTFNLTNELLWNIGHDYYVSGTNGSGESFNGDEIYIEFFGVLLETEKIEAGTVLTLYKDGTVLWISDKINESCTINYYDSAFSDYQKIEK